MSEKQSMSVRRFLDAMFEENEGEQRFCFILGSGASYASGIRTGVKLMEEWHRELLLRERERGNGYIKECAEAAGYNWEDCKEIFESEEQNLKNEDYFTLYDIRFVGSPTAGYAFLEKEMEGKSPNVGYYYLASILHNTNNRLVITTNFDSLTEDALFYYSGHHPLVLGDERLASYISGVDRKPVIAKIHRDLLMNPMNHAKEMEQLQQEWKAPLSAALARYIPIVIGYAGGDKTLMSLLGELNLKGIFWCTLGETPPDMAMKIIEKNRGYWVKIKGFDELMYQMVERIDKKPSVEEMRQATDGRYNEYEQRDQKLREEYSISYMKGERTEKVKQDVAMIQAVDRELSRQTSELKEYNELLTQALINWSTKDAAKALELCTKAINMRPDIAKGYDYRSTFYHLTNEYDKALADENKVIELDGSNADYYRSRGITLHALGRYDDAIVDKGKAIEIEPNNARYYNSRSVTLHRMKRYEEALADVNRAIEIASGNAEYYNSRSVTLHDMERYEEALADSDKAIEIEPDNAEYYNSRSVTLHKMKRYEEALADVDKAIKIEPGNAEYYDSRSLTLHDMERYEEALADSDKAIEIAPDNAEYYDSRSMILHTMKRYEEALTAVNKAIELQPGDVDFIKRQNEILADINSLVK